MNLVELRARAREDLQDEDSADYHWTDDQIDGAIQRVVAEYSAAVPAQKQDDLATTADNVELDISTLTDLLLLQSIEFPIDQHPPYMQRFQMWADRVFMVDKGDGNDARVRWLQAHTVAAGSSTVPAKHDELLILGATGYLAMSASAYTVDRASIAGRYGTMSYRAWGKERLARYDTTLATVSHRIERRTLYTEE